MEQQQKDDNSGQANFTCTDQIVTTTDTIDSVDMGKLENENEYFSSPSSSEDEVSEDKNCSTLTDIILIQSPVLGEDKNKECKDIIMNVEEKAGYSTQPTPVEIDSDLRRKNVPYRAPRYFDPCYESGQSSDEDKKCKKGKKHIKRKRCYNCGDASHRGPKCKHVNDCLICSKKGHLIKDCPQINIEVDSTSKLCLKCGNEGHDLSTCNTEYISEDLREIQCYVCKDFGHLCCVEYKTDEPTEVSCCKCGESGHLGSVCAVIESIAVDLAIFCKKCTKRNRFDSKRPCRKCNKARKAAAKASVKAATEKVATVELKSAKGKKSVKRSCEEKVMGIPTVNNVRPIRHKAIWPLPVPPVFGPYYGRPGSNIWLNPALAAARNGPSKPQYPPLNWTRQPVTEASRQPLNWTCPPVTETSGHPLNWSCQPATETSRQPLNWIHQSVIETSRQLLNWTHQPVTSRHPRNWTHEPVTETSQDPAKSLYPSMHCPRQTNIQKETECISEMVLPEQSSSHQSTVHLHCRNSNNETVNQNFTGSPNPSATDPSPAS